MNVVLVFMFLVAVVCSNPVQEERFHPDVDGVENDVENKLRHIEENIKDAEALAAKVNVKDIKDEKIRRRQITLKETLASLIKSVHSINDALRKKKDVKTERKEKNDKFVSLEDSLEKAIAEDKREKKNDVKHDGPDKREEFNLYTADEVFGGFHDFDDIAKDTKKDASEPMAGMHPDRPITAHKKDSPKKKDTVRKEKKDTVRKEKKDTVRKEEQKTKMNDEMEKERKRQVNEVKDTVIGIKSDFMKIKKNFEDMKDLYTEVVKDEPLHQPARSKFEEINEDIKNVMNDLQNIKDQFSAANQNEMRDESMDDPLDEIKTKTLLTGMKDSLQETSDAIQDLVEIAKIEKQRKYENDENDLADLNMLKDNVKAVIHRMLDVRQLIKQKDATMMQKREKNMKKEDEGDVKDRLFGIREDLNRIKEAVDDMAKRHA